MRRFRVKALLAAESISTEAPILEPLDDVSDSDLGIEINAKAIEDEEPEYSEDDTVRVFIVFDDESVVEAGYSTDNIAENNSAM